MKCLTCPAVAFTAAGGLGMILLMQGSVLANATLTLTIPTHPKSDQHPVAKIPINPSPKHTKHMKIGGRIKAVKCSSSSSSSSRGHSSRGHSSQNGHPHTRFKKNKN
ncbi:uncharacterized protein MONBRDRAFT_25369 [Monosiga brevicollis MX1]|uniref:Uncharacterized protein n=1 Tax=Monosiga brevicollis TaxID=81824 RepID=A9UZ77_MONBE|nr:uncharacterized protein MONBRDRAFT_25369 [Monosiga brevicollis MX1]EDQ89318.1 predicted protein [Monosiga brevicollis MX1]|eukprot:XP_001745894.1 hypothetical protein [Monosiga brevicollis MX1]